RFDGPQGDRQSGSFAEGAFVILINLRVRQCLGEIVFAVQGCLGDRVKWNVAPLPGSASAQTLPPCLWTMRCTVARPKPYPANSSARCRRWNTPKSLSL